MDYSKIKKIFYILCIISILLSLKSKVFGVGNVYTSLENQNYTLPDFSYLAEENSDYPVSVIVERTSGTWLFFIKQEVYNGLNTPYFGVVPKPASNTGYNFYFVNHEKNYLLTNNNWVLTNSGLNNNTLVSLNMLDFIASNIDIKNSAGDTTYFNANISYFYAPFFDNVTEIENGYPDGVFISRGDYSENDKLYFHLLKITNTVADGNQSVYYYNDKIFELVKGNKYYQTYLEDNPSDHSYYFVDRASLSLDTDSSYLYVLSNNSSVINNSYGILQPDESAGIYDVVESDTAGVISAQDAINDKIQNINNNQQEITNTLTENTISTDTETDIDTSLNFNNNNSDLTGFHNGFFTRLANILNSLIDYDLDEDSTIEFPVPYSNQSIILHSYSIKNNIPESLYNIIQAFWLFIFTFYLFKFINKIYISFSTGEILSNFDSKDEVVTNSML